MLLKKMMGRGLVSFCVVEGTVRLVRIPGQLWNILVPVKSVETFSVKLAMCWVIFSFDSGPACGASLRIMNGTSLGDMMEGRLNDFAVSLY